MQEQAPSILSTFQGIFQGLPVTVHETSRLENPGAEGGTEFKEELCALLSGGKIDMIIYCLKGNETRIRHSLINSLQKYTNMGLDWRKTVIAVTLANSFPITAREKKPPPSLLQTSSKGVWIITLRRLNRHSSMLG